jgi:hypothetical protein
VSENIGIPETPLILHYITGLIGNQWFNKWIDVSNRVVAEAFRYDQKSNFLNYKI